MDIDEVLLHQALKSELLVLRLADLHIWQFDQELVLDEEAQSAPIFGVYKLLEVICTQSQEGVVTWGVGCDVKGSHSITCYNSVEGHLREQEFDVVIWTFLDHIFKLLWTEDIN